MQAWNPLQSTPSCCIISLCSELQDTQDRITLIILDGEVQIMRVRIHFECVGRTLADDKRTEHYQLPLRSCQDFGQKGHGVTYLCEERLVKGRTSSTD